MDKELFFTFFVWGEYMKKDLVCQEDFSRLFKRSLGNILFE